MRKLLGTSAIALAAVLLAAPVGAKDASKAEVAESAGTLPPKAQAFLKELHPQTGDVTIPAAKAVMHLGDRYYFLPAAEARRVLVEAWGNPPSQGDGVLGMVIEKGKTVFDSPWAAVITYEDTGHVSDAKAKEEDYASVLKNMQEGQEAANPEREKAGYPAMHLTGWAQPPSYDAASHSLIWARELQIAGEPTHALNYDVRLLGRTGVLSLNMLSEMPLLGDVRTAAQTFGKAVTFEPGAGYADFNASTDKAAEYVLAGLVAGGVAVAAAKKLGFLALILKFGKVILIGLAAAGAAAFGFLRKLFGRNREEEGAI
jgi:uncharacterized membrane-anchored protein